MSDLYFRPGSWDADIWKEVAVYNEYCLGQLDPGDTVLDVGAHIGAFTYRALDAGAGLVVAVEPFHENANSWRHNIHDACDAADRAILITAAAWNPAGPVALAPLQLPNTGGSGILDAGARKVRALTPRSLIELAVPTGQLRLLKLDCEGGEKHFLRRGVLDRVDAVCGELHSMELPRIPGFDARVVHKTEHLALFWLVRRGTKTPFV